MMIKRGKKIISRKERVCKGLFSQGLGLMFRKKHNLIMIFNKPRKISLHNLFVFYSIDVLLLDENFKILEIKRRFKPFTFWSSTERGKYLVELAFPSKYEVGNVLEIKKV